MLLSNNHTPLIAHTGDDLLTTATGLYGDRQGDAIANDYQTYNPTARPTRPPCSRTGTTRSTTPRRRPNAGHDTNPNLVYSPMPPATAARPVKPDTITPAPWVPYTGPAATSARSPR